MPEPSAEGDPTSEGRAAMRWMTYKDPVFGFSLRYPETYTILKEPGTFADVAPTLLGRLRLLEPALARSAFAEMEPPKFSIEIHAKAAALSARGWIDANLAGGDEENVAVGGVACVRVTLPSLMAPNRWIVCEHGGVIYTFTPLGPGSQEILDSFTFGLR